LGNRLREERAPREKPEQQQAVKEKNGDGVVVARIAFVEVAEKLFVDEIKPEKAFGLAGGWIAKGSENVPGGSDEKKDQGAGGQMHLEEVAEVPREKQEQENDGAGKHDANEALGENAESDESGDAPAGKKGRLFGLPAVEEEIEGEADPEADGDVRNENTREEVRSARGQKNDAGPETGLRGEKAAAKEKEQESDGEDAEVEEEACAPGVSAEEFHTSRHAPIGEGRLFEIADAVFMKGDPVMAEENVVGGVGVGGVHVVL